MTKVTQDNLDAWIQSGAAKQQGSRAAELKRAKTEAGERGKEPFDLDRLRAIYPGQPSDSRRSRDQLNAHYEYAYYVAFPAAMDLDEYAAMQLAEDAGDALRQATSPNERIDRARKLIHRARHASAKDGDIARAQARQDITEAIGQLESAKAVTALERPRSDAVAEGAAGLATTVDPAAAETSVVDTAERLLVEARLLLMQLGEVQPA